MDHSCLARICENVLIKLKKSVNFVFDRNINNNYYNLSRKKKTPISRAVGSWNLRDWTAREPPPEGIWAGPLARAQLESWATRLMCFGGLDLGRPE